MVDQIRWDFTAPAAARERAVGTALDRHLYIPRTRVRLRLSHDWSFAGESPYFCTLAFRALNPPFLDVIKWPTNDGGTRHQNAALGPHGCHKFSSLSKRRTRIRLLDENPTEPHGTTGIAPSLRSPALLYHDATSCMTCPHNETIVRRRRIFLHKQPP